jgi:hypothetical protein
MEPVARARLRWRHEPPCVGVGGGRVLDGDLLQLRAAEIALPRREPAEEPGLLVRADIRGLLVWASQEGVLDKSCLACSCQRPSAPPPGVSSCGSWRTAVASMPD